MKQFSFIYSALVLTVFCATSPVIQAHDFWLEASPFYQKPNKNIHISVHVGENMKGEQLPNIPSWYREFDVITGSGLNEVEGDMGSDPAGIFYHETEGVYAIGYLSSKKTVELPATKFSPYLQKQGLEKIIQQRKDLGESAKNGIEIYSRNVKTLVKIGDKNEVNFYDYDFSYPLNISPMQDPYSLKVGDELKVKVTFNKKPAQGLLLKAQIKHNKTFKFETRTDEQGFAILPIQAKGIWLIHTVEMQRSNYDEIDWESFWSSITFEQH